MATMTNSIDNDLGNLKKDLIENIMSDNWEEVIKTYEKNPRAHALLITSSKGTEKKDIAGQTVLHMAVTEGRENVVEKLVKAITTLSYDGQAAATLGIRDERGNTALHFAAEIGNSKMCSCIASADSSLIGVHNNKGETPLFWAVMYGQKEVFSFLRSKIIVSPQQDVLDYCIRSDGQTILHCAIIAEEFELAIEIIDLYKELVNVVDQQGFSPLRILADMPSCFRSSGTYHLGRWSKILYYLVTPIVLRLVRSRRTTTYHHDDDIENGAHEIIQTGTGNYHDDQAQAQGPCGFNFGKFLCKLLRSIGYEGEKHLLAIQIVDELLKHMTDNEISGAYPFVGSKSNDNPENFGDCKESGQKVESPPLHSEKEKKKKVKSPLLIAARSGVWEIVDRILKRSPKAIHDADKEGKNILLHAAENHHWQLCKSLLFNKAIPKSLLIRKVDNEGNTALHLTAMHVNNYWPVPGAALQMQWEIKWYKFVEKSMPRGLFAQPNNKGKTPEEIFTENHQTLVQTAGTWLTTTSTACSGVAAVIATVVYVSCTNFPGGINEESGKPNLLNQRTLDLFMNSSLAALSFSVISLLMFIGLLTSRHREKYFETTLPRELLLGITSLFLSVIAVLTSFCSGYFFVLEEKIKHVWLLVYAVTFLPVFLFAVAEFPLFIDVVQATFWTPF